MELPSGQQSQPIGTASAASAEQVNSGSFSFCLFGTINGSSDQLNRQKYQ